MRKVQYKKDSICLCCSESLNMSFYVREKKMKGKGGRKRREGDIVQQRSGPKERSHKKKKM